MTRSSVIERRNIFKELLFVVAFVSACLRSRIYLDGLLPIKSNDPLIKVPEATKFRRIMT